MLDTRQQPITCRTPVPQPEPIAWLTLTSADAAAVRSLADRVIDSRPGTSPQEQLNRLAVISHELPLAIREAMVELRLSDHRFGGLVLSGLTVLDDELGATPSGASDHRNAELTRVDTMLLLIASLLGDPISHAEIEDGRLIRDVRPVPGDETTQLGSSSEVELAWHIEDAFHEFRADWLFLLCLRNPSGAATSFARLRDVALSDQVSSVLFEERFLVSPDSSRQEATAVTSDRRIAVLSGDPQTPFVRLDPVFMSKSLGDPQAEAALETIIDAIDHQLQDVVLAPGDLLIVDNLKSVHGRRPFEASYDGRDRWLRVVHTAPDLRKSAGRRTGSHGRAILEQR